MPLYELAMVARSQLRSSNPSLMIGNGLEVEKQRLKELLKFCAKHVLDNNGELVGHILRKEYPLHSMRNLINYSQLHRPKLDHLMLEFDFLHFNRFASNNSIPRMY